MKIIVQLLLTYMQSFSSLLIKIKLQYCITIAICLYLRDLFRQVIKILGPRVVFVMMVVPWDVLAGGVVQSLGSILIRVTSVLPLAAAIQCLPPDRLPSPVLPQNHNKVLRQSRSFPPHVRSH